MCRIKAQRNDDSTDLCSKTRNIKSDIRDVLNRLETEFGIDMTLFCHQALQSDDMESEIELGLKDLVDIFQGNNYEVLMVQTYRDGWPVNRAGSGSDPGNNTPVRGLYIVGDGAKGSGGIEVEGVAMGVERTIRFLSDR